MSAGNESYPAIDDRTWYRYRADRLVPSGSSFNTGPTRTYEEVVMDPSLMVPPVFNAQLVREVSRRMDGFNLGPRESRKTPISKCNGSGRNLFGVLDWLRSVRCVSQSSHGSTSLWVTDGLDDRILASAPQLL
jgi:hypothetical protein